jgi:protein-L-isoaspartate(D-aspartate) O-methyltransferase
MRAKSFILAVVVGLMLVVSLLHAADIFQEQRRTMVVRDIQGRGVQDRQVLAAMGKVPRHLLVDERQRHDAYADHPLPIGEGQTISQPYVVALMTEALAEAHGPGPGDRHRSPLAAVWRRSSKKSTA